ncbi:MAG: hypothetical protein PHQ59_01005 [Candidatus Daviesbacteria bacterium]|nr:hypothetical protein [Candidatus Daviesbacteria bacterium]
MTQIENIIIWLLFIWATYHLTRDLLQDILHIHHPLIDMGHKKPVRQVSLLGKFHRYWALPIEATVLLLTIKSLSASEFGLMGISSVSLFIAFLAFWLWTWIK